MLVESIRHFHQGLKTSRGNLPNVYTKALAEFSTACFPHFNNSQRPRRWAFVLAVQQSLGRTITQGKLQRSYDSFSHQQPWTKIKKKKSNRILVSGFFKLEVESLGQPSTEVLKLPKGIFRTHAKTLLGLSDTLPLTSTPFRGQKWGKIS